MLILLSGVLIVAVIVFVGAVVKNFWGMSYSDNISDWGALGSYVSMIVSLLNLVLFVILTYAALDFSKTSQRVQSDFQLKSFEHQMTAQKIELKTAFRKSYIENIRQKTFDINELPFYEIVAKDDDLIKFRKEIESLSRMFKIYERNKNKALFGDCSYRTVIDALNIVEKKAKSIREDESKDERQRKANELWNELNVVYLAMIDLEGELSDYTFSEIDKMIKTQD